MNLRSTWRDFTDPALNGTFDHPVSLPQLVLAMVSVGYPSWPAALAVDTLHKAWSVRHRIALVRAFLTQLPAGYSRSPEYDSADPSEKAGFSYYFGLMSALLALRRRLGVTHLIHYDLYFKEVTGGFPMGVRPDLLSLEPICVVVECKGRSRGRFDATSIQSAKDQAKVIAKLSTRATSRVVKLNIAALTTFYRGYLNIDVFDPSGSEGELVIDLTDDALYERYYTPLRGLINELDHNPIEIDQRNYAVAYDEVTDVHVGLDLGLMRPGFTATYRGDLPLQQDHIGQDTNDHTWLLGSDGVAVRLGPSWSDQ